MCIRNPFPLGLLLGGWLALVPARAADPAADFELREGDRVVFVGDALFEGEQYHGWIELMLTTRFADRGVIFRNLGWNGDTPAGVSRAGLSLLQAGREPADEGWKQLVRQLTEARPTVALVGYGMASSFDGAAGLAGFKADCERLLDALAKASPGVRIILVGPIRHEALGSPWPDPAPHNEQLALYSKAAGEAAAARRLRFVPLFDRLAAPRAAAAEKMTQNGIHLNDRGYRMVAEILENELLGTAGAWRTSPQTEALRQAILRKNEWFFHRSRPANMAYIFGFRKREQGNNAVEVLKFDEYLAAEEQRIAQLRTLRPVSAPPAPLRTGNLTARHVEQPHPKFEVAEGLEVTLWAEDPQLNKPIHMNFDPRGRLWVASSEVYPQIEPGQAATDKIIVLEDTQGRGRADRATVFADGLLIPTGVEPGDGGVYVAQSTELLHLRDTNGDGKADVRRTVLSGFGTEDTHHNLHGLHWGMDGRLYMNQSVYTRTNTETPHGVVRLKAGGIFRFDPRDQRMEILFRGWVNAWGHQFDDFGQSFVTDGAGFQGISWGIPGATYRTLAPARRELQSVSPGSYPKFCGLEIIRSDHFPADWQGDMITCDFRAHRVVRFKLAEDGSGFVTREMPDLMRSTADTFRPLDVKLGPDGALYLADWSNPIIQHGEVDFRDPRRDKEHGRIWRIAWKGRPAGKRTDFPQLDSPALLDRLIAPNSYDQDQARRVLIERGAERVLPELAAWMRRQTGEPARLQAMWLYQALGRPPADLLDTLLASPDARVRAAAVRALPSDGALERLAKRVADEHPRVRLEAVRALGRIQSVRAADLALTVLDRPMDPFLDYALWLTVNELAEPWLAAVAKGTWKIEGRERHLEFGLRAIEPALAGEVLAQLVADRGIPPDGSGPWIELIGAAGGAKDLGRLFESLLRGEFVERAALRALAALSDAARLREARPEGDLTRLGRRFEQGNPEMRMATLQLAGAWQLAAFTPRLVQAAGDENAAPGERAAALAALREIGGTRVIAALKRLVDETSSPAVRREAIVVLAGLDLRAALPEVIKVLRATTSEAEAVPLWRGLLGIRGFGNRLAAELPKAQLPPAAARAGLRPAREGGQNQNLVQALLRIAGLTVSATSLSPADLQQLAQEALAHGDAARGEQIYRRPDLACMACHAIGGAGGKVGPDLTSIGASAPPDYLVESLLYPNAKIKEGYHSVLLTLRDQQELSGMIVREDANVLILRNAANQEIPVPIRNIVRRTSVGSLMPAGLVDSLLPEERHDLIRFLAALGKPGEFDAARGRVARLWQLYLIVSQNEHLGIERVVNGDFSLGGWTPAFSLVNGALTRETCEAAFPNRANNRGFFAAARFTSSAGGAVSFRLVGEVKRLWINGEPAKPAATFAAQTKPGVNAVVLQLDDVNPPTRLSLSAESGSFLVE